MVVNHMSPDEIKIAWDNRDNLAEELERNGSMPVRTLYIRLDQGGTLALGLLKNGKGAVLIDWTNACYQISELIRPQILLEPYVQREEGFGGMFGFGEKGALGWTLRIEADGKICAREPVLPNITAIADLLAGNDRFLNGRRKPREAPLGQLRPEDRETCLQILTLWERLVMQNS